MSQQPIPPPVPSAIYSIVPPVFLYVAVHNKIVGNTFITWELGYHFNEPLPYSFQLQFGRTALPYVNNDGVPRIDDWQDVGSPVVNTYFTYDPVQHLYGKTAELHYRLILTTGLGNVYYSQPANVYGTLGVRDALVAKDILRQERLRHIKQTSINGYLLKAFRYGPLCTCIDPITKEVTNAHCLSCYGTGWAGGYFNPLPFSYFDISTDSTREALNPETGTSKQQAVQARFSADVQVYDRDVWVNKNADARYYIQGVKTEAQIRGIPLIQSAEIRIAPFTDIIYQLPLSSA